MMELNVNQEHVQEQQHHLQLLNNVKLIKVDVYGMVRHVLIHWWCHAQHIQSQIVHLILEVKDNV